MRNIFKRKPKPIDWFAEPKNVSIFRRGNNLDGHQIPRAIFAVPGVNNVIVMVEYIDRHCLEIMVSGGDKSAIAEAIFNTKPIGVSTIGNQAVQFDYIHCHYVINFTHISYLMDYAQ